ncbi:hypothetical protein LD125_00137 [Mesoplasma sp. JKS002658]|uniref:hypothetical protein n=1 Tax=Mesoplasma whartonense TaxID=2878854 RepID=UPI002022A4EC|nr:MULTISPECIES: hypothetical protein [unclassified Mesoplasma]MCL8211550.1 hypothetical protein [Mesoplasma sp. JKS002664]MCL8212010.1 hypothetical protein [Mesoplasma sp. JKS002662]MCL8213885.1 hypothetical protein [Mesoplasma sp. JKS002658]MCL8214851.1 hypothetical protein [Mesoplasma sp. JKS002663]MCL8215204.1 hypothetical protein [Mesoplasma sp. JKS002659]
MNINQVISNQMAKDDVLASIINYNDSEQGLLLAPNFMFVNKPTTIDKQSYYKLIVWFELIANNNQVDWTKLPRAILLTNLSFTLFKRENSGLVSIDYATKQPSALMEQLFLKYDDNNHRIEIKHQDFFEYKIPSTLIDPSSNDFLFNLEYQSTSKIGLTNNYGVGFNKGFLNIKTATETIRDNNFVSNQVVACLSRDTTTKQENVFYPLLRKTISLKANFVQTRMRSDDPLLGFTIDTTEEWPPFLAELVDLKNILWDIRNSLVGDEIVVGQLKIIGSDEWKNYYNFDEVNYDFQDKRILRLADHFDYDYNLQKIVKTSSGDVLFSSEFNQTLLINLLLFGKPFTYKILINNHEPIINYDYQELDLIDYVTYQPQDFFLSSSFTYEIFTTKLRAILDEQSKNCR